MIMTDSTYRVTLLIGTVCGGSVIRDLYKPTINAIPDQSSGTLDCQGHQDELQEYNEPYYTMIPGAYQERLDLCLLLCSLMWMHWP